MESNITKDIIDKKLCVKYEQLDFKATECPSWRQNVENLPLVSEMVCDIVELHQEWLKMKSKCAKDSVDEILNEMKIRFIHHVNVGEEIGTQTLEETKAVLHGGGCQVFKDKTKTRKRSISKSESETINIQSAMDFMDTIVEQETDKDSVLGLLEQTEFIKEVHRVLMNGVNECTTKPGHYSSNLRSAEYNGETHFYPKFDNEHEAEIQVQILIDIYNGAIDKIRRIESPEKIEMVFKCAAWFFFEFISLHPFGDGNGRLSRLLCNYILCVITPFPTSIYNIYCESKKTDYVDAIISARQSKSRHPCDLAAMIIECNWSGWKYFMEKLKSKGQECNDVHAIVSGHPCDQQQ